MVLFINYYVTEKVEAHERNPPGVPPYRGNKLKIYFAIIGKSFLSG